MSMTHAAPVIAHPPYCALEHCETLRDNVEHRSEPARHIPAVDFDYPVSVAIGRLDEVFQGEQWVGPTCVVLTVGDADSTNELRAGMSADNARAVAADLIAHADRLDALASEGVR